uniref:ATP synthase complex subunit 8 n=1 Tax=Parazen pacificus TaxID=181440 RepID=Q8HLG6_PARPF|nr:ATP synthase F0 subunit 8 [Parazen pacificus]BAC23532.1 ATPase subunit 8 [Parazen pacificus]
MPQLDPNPWLSIFLLTWSVFLVVLPTKILAHNFPNELILQITEATKANSWNWPWL